LALSHPEGSDIAGLLAEAHAKAAAGEDADAMLLYVAVLERDPAVADAANNLGVLLRRRGDPAGAIRRYRQCLAAAPQHPDATWNLGRALLDAGEADEAFLLLRRAAEGSRRWDRLHMLGRACQQRDDLAGAEAAYGAALALQSNAVETLNNLASVSQAKGEPERALELLDRAVANAPSDGDIRFNRALLLLLLGRMADGWREHEWRWHAKGFTSPRRSFAFPAWQGEPVRGTLLVHWEQGLGDTLQFVRFLPEARRRVDRLVLEVQPALAGLLRGIEGADEVIAAGDALPPCHAHVALMSLNHRLGLETVERPIPYIAPSADRVAYWRRRTAAPELRVGLVWSGNPFHGNDRHRSLPPALLRPLLELDFVAWFSLQVGPRRDGLRAAGLGERVVDLAPELHDFGETAAAIAALDFVVSVDTAVVHLCGALGRTACLLLPFSPDWRWGRAGQDTLWYPSLRIFRQPAPLQWAEPLRGIETFLRNSRK
jgi:Flp pilus assembly protein TadD